MIVQAAGRGAGQVDVEEGSRIERDAARIESSRPRRPEGLPRRDRPGIGNRARRRAADGRGAAAQGRSAGDGYGAGGGQRSVDQERAAVDGRRAEVGTRPGEDLRASAGFRQCKSLARAVILDCAGIGVGLAGRRVDGQRRGPGVQIGDDSSRPGAARGQAADVDGLSGDVERHGVGHRQRTRGREAAGGTCLRAASTQSQIVIGLGRNYLVGTVVFNRPSSGSERAGSQKHEGVTSRASNFEKPAAGHVQHADPACGIAADLYLPRRRELRAGIEYECCSPSRVIANVYPIRCGIRDIDRDGGARQDGHVVSRSRHDTASPTGAGAPKPPRCRAGNRRIRKRIRRHQPRSRPRRIHPQRRIQRILRHQPPGLNMTVGRTVEVVSTAIDDRPGRRVFVVVGQVADLEQHRLANLEPASEDVGDVARGIVGRNGLHPCDEALEQRIVGQQRPHAGGRGLEGEAG